MKIDVTKIIGKKFHRLTVLSHAGADKHRRQLVRCKCECGNETVVGVSKMIGGKPRSCGCLHAENMAKGAHATHGLRYDPMYRAWKGMIERCYRPKHKSWDNYGGRGIRVCEFLRATPANYKLLMGKRPFGKSLDRINNDANYSCGSCAECSAKGWTMNLRWATPKEQSANSRRQKIVEIGGVSRRLQEWSEISGVSAGAIHQRLRAGVCGLELLHPSKRKIV